MVEKTHHAVTTCKYCRLFFMYLPNRLAYGNEITLIWLPIVYAVNKKNAHLYSTNAYWKSYVSN